MGINPVVITDTPYPGSDVPICLSKAIKNVGSCAASRDKGIRANRQQTSIDVAVENNAQYLDVSHWVCTIDTCPVITGNTVAGTTGQVVSTVSQRDIGIQLRVLPLIGKDGSVQLQVSQSVEDILGEVTLDGNQQPIIGRRTTDSFVSARSGEVVVLGGLQRRQQTKQTNRLGPIPFLGDLLGNSKDQDTRTELVIFLRPYVLNNSAVDNLDALGRIDASPMKEDVRKVVDKSVPPFVPTAPAQK